MLHSKYLPTNVSDVHVLNINYEMYLSPQKYIFSLCDTLGLAFPGMKRD